MFKLNLFLNRGWREQVVSRVDIVQEAEFDFFIKFLDNFSDPSFAVRLVRYNVDCISEDHIFTMKSQFKLVSDKWHLLNYHVGGLSS